MSFVDRYLPYFMQQLIICLLSAVLPFQSLFTESLCGDLILALPPLSGALTAPHRLAVCSFSVPCLLFSFYLFIYCGAGV
jgi:hypothetical protein